jgi:heme-degrading monooxygenase HmoA
MIQPSKSVTLINVFTVDPKDQQKLIDVLARATDEAVRRAPGFISATLHRSIDGTRVAMYALWRSIEDYEEMRRDPAPFKYLEEALAIAKFDPGIYSIVRSFSPDE